MYETDSRTKTALFRYGVIAPLVCRRLDPDTAKQIRSQILEQQFEYPDGSRRPVPIRTIRYWVAKYRKFGFKGLFDDFRSDKGTNRAMSVELLEQAKELRKEEPARSVRTIIELLRKTGYNTDSLTERTLARRLKAIGATKQLLKKGPARINAGNNCTQMICGTETPRTVSGCAIPKTPTKQRKPNSSFLLTMHRAFAPTASSTSTNNYRDCSIVLARHF